MTTGDRIALVASAPFAGLFLGLIASADFNWHGPGGIIGGAAIGGVISLALYLVLPRESPQSQTGAPTVKAAPVDVGPLEHERDELLKELEKAANDKDSPLDPVTVEAQRHEIEANYQRKNATAANMGGHR